MAKAATAKSDSNDAKKKKKTAQPATAKLKAKKAVKSAKSDTKAGRKTVKKDGLDGLAKLIDHPLVADLLAAGAIAAVAAIAEHQMGKGKRQTSSRMVKSVGKAAAAAMGKKLFGDLGAIAGAATDAARKA